HRYEVPPRKEWERDVWWMDDEVIGVLEDWEEELYGVVVKPTELYTNSPVEKGEKSEEE
ncbi:hypothetical protein HDU98_008310, partial [Podochytrium sp. JEL0797]